LGSLTEMLRGEIRVRLSREVETIAEVCHPVDLLARTEWGGAGTMAELLPAFVMPNDPAVGTLLKGASEVLRRAGKPHSIDGYNSGSRQRVWELVSALWSAVAGRRIAYALPPASFESEGQKVRTSAAILDARIGRCGVVPVRWTVNGFRDKRESYPCAAAESPSGSLAAAACG